MKYSMLRFAAITVAASFLCSCAPLPRTVAFEESSFIHYRGSGSGAVNGTAFTVQNDKSVVTANHTATVKLMPANAYTDELVEKHYWGHHKIDPADPRFSKYVRTTHPDDAGKFSFHNLPAGDYYASCHLHWTYPATTYQDDGTEDNYDAAVEQWIYVRLSVKDGHTTSIATWGQGK